MAKAQSNVRIVTVRVNGMSAECSKLTGRSANTVAEAAERSAAFVMEKELYDRSKCR